MDLLSYMLAAFGFSNIPISKHRAACTLYIPMVCKKINGKFLFHGTSKSSLCPFLIN